MTTSENTVKWGRGENFRVLNLFNKRREVRNEPGFDLALLNASKYRHHLVLCTHWRIPSNASSASTGSPRAWTAKLPCLPLNSTPRPWEETEQCSLERTLWWTRHVPLHKGPVRRPASGKVRGENWNGIKTQHSNATTVSPDKSTPVKDAKLLDGSQFFKNKFRQRMCCATIATFLAVARVI